jgi:nitrogen fixation protein NifB
MNDSLDDKTHAINPVQAYSTLQKILAGGTRVSMTGVRGPGDSLADFPNTLAYLRMVRDGFPDMPLCLTSIGVSGNEWVDELSSLGLAQITLLVDAVSPEVALELYTWIRPGRKNLPKPAAVDLLIDKQIEAVRAYSAAGIDVHIVTTVRPGINDREVGAIARAMKAAGAKSMTVVAAKGVEAETLLNTLRGEAAQFLPAGDYDEEEPVCRTECCARPVPSGIRPCVAVTSSDASVVDTHLGQAQQFLIYGPKNGTVSLLGTRPAPAPGSGPARWEGVAEILSDCMYLLVASAGHKPREVLAAHGLTVIIAEGGVDGMVDGLYDGGRKCKK